MAAYQHYKFMNYLMFRLKNPEFIIALKLFEYGS
jgi:hypothetical protein